MEGERYKLDERKGIAKREAAKKKRRDLTH